MDRQIYPLEEQSIYLPLVFSLLSHDIGHGEKDSDVLFCRAEEGGRYVPAAGPACRSSLPRVDVRLVFNTCSV